VNDTVRCPLHHACFSLRTGEVLRAPALSPIPCYDIKHELGMIYVTGSGPPRVNARYSHAFPEDSGASCHRRRGAAGAAAALTLRQEDIPAGSP
jgi:hypothetical protein